MQPFTVFLNELSCTFEEATQNDIGRHVLNLIAVLRSIKKIRPDLVIRSHDCLIQIALGTKNDTFSAVLKHADYREEWRFLKSLMNKAPWGEELNEISTPLLEEVFFLGQRALGMTWAQKNNADLISFAYHDNWLENEIRAELSYLCPDSSEIIKDELTIRNFSQLPHVYDSSHYLENYGHQNHTSTLIFSGDDFAVRMYPFDHNPAHIHIFSPNDISNCLASFRIDTFDLLAGNLRTALQNTIREWTNLKRRDLEDNWQRCQRGEILRPIL